MKQINGYWVDENNNRWNIGIYTEEQAEKFSKSLVNCYNCNNCGYCDNCRSCHNCRYCNKCNDCNNCRYCDYCDYCNSCRYCRYCCDCRYCHDCCNYKQNPQRYTTKKIDSKNDQITFYYGETKNNEKEIQVVCGCFRGNLEDFEKAVLETHKDNDLYRKQYLKEIEKVKVLFELGVAYRHGFGAKKKSLALRQQRTRLRHK